jgi:hypothetical protein
MKSKFLSGAFGLLVVASPMLHAEITCSAAEYKGSWAFYTTGSLLKLPPEGAVLVGPFSQAGTFTMDGLGGVTIESTASYNGLVQPANVPATYTITPDCRVKFFLTLPFPLSVPSEFTGVMSSSMREEVLTITQPPGTVILGRHFKQDQRFCGNPDFVGAFEVDLRGYFSAPKEIAGMAAINGRLVADGAGNFTASWLANYAGNIVPQEIAGTYDVNAKCHVSLKYTAGGTAQSMTGALGGKGDVAAMMLTTAGSSMSGTFRSQQLR